MDLAEEKKPILTVDDIFDEIKRAGPGPPPSSRKAEVAKKLREDYAKREEELKQLTD